MKLVCAPPRQGFESKTLKLGESALPSSKMSPPYDLTPWIDLAFGGKNFNVKSKI